MTTLILGNGLIAKALTRRLVEEGKEVIVASRDITDQVKGASYKQYTLEEMAGDKSLFEGIDRVVHTISTSAPANSMNDIYKDAQENILLNVKLMGLLAELRTPKFIFISSGGSVYGQQYDSSADELHPTNPISAYGVAKLAVEKYLHLYGIHQQLNYLVIRPSNVYGYIKSIKKPQGVINHLLDCAFNSKQFKLWGSPESRKDYLYIDDFTDGLFRALEYEGKYPSNVYNLSYGKTYSLGEIIQLVEKLSGKPISMEQVGEARFDVPNIEVNGKLFKKDFNWSPKVDIETGISLMRRNY